jgi:hypothetical protein
MKGYKPIFLMLLFINCSGNNQKQLYKKNSVDSNYIDSSHFQKSDEIEIYFIDVISKSIKNQGINNDLDVLTFKYPSETDPFYWIKVGESLPNSFKTQFNFVCDTRSKEVMYLDVYTGDSINIISNNWYRK